MTERRRGLSVRVKLTLSYAGFVVIVAIAVFALGFLILRFVPEGNLSDVNGAFAPGRSDLVEVFLRYVWWTLAGLAAVGLGGGWIVSGIMLRPLKRVTDAAELARGGRLDHRIALAGRRDELTELADTFDSMLTAVQHSIEEQRRFAANASHELRTPHATIRTMLEVARASPTAIDVDRLLTRLDDTNERAIRLTEAILSLSRASSNVPLVLAPLEITTIVSEVVAGLAPEAARVGVALRVDLAGVPGVEVLAEETLMRQLISNLVRNAIVHNLDNEGWVHVSARSIGPTAVIEVVNTGPHLSTEVVVTLQEPFVRAASRTRSRGDGVGLGLAIASAIIHAHRGELHLTAREGGGLEARARVPLA